MRRLALSLLFIFFFLPSLAYAQTSPTINSVQTYFPATTFVAGEKPVGISALAYDAQNKPIWSGVTYEWGVSSTGSIGSVSPINRDVSTFTPLNPGTGDVFVIARMGTQSFTASRSITVNVPPLRGDVNGDGHVGLSDLSILLSNFGRVNALKNQGDVDGNGNVSLSDLSTLLSNFGK